MARVAIAGQPKCGRRSAVGEAAITASRLVVLGLALLAIVVARSVQPFPGPRPNLAGAGLTPDQIKTAAATKLEDATAKGGSGYRFEIVQTSTIKARAGGPKIDIPDPSNAFDTIGQADEYFFYALIEQGIVTPDGFWSEMRTGPNPGHEADFEKAEPRRAALVVNGVRWRNDQEGWYQAQVLPGIGLDPETAALLPELLRDSTGAISKDALVVDDKTLIRVDASGTVADIPGLVSADGATFTKLIAPLELAFDDQGRLARIHAVALNTNMKDFDLVVDTVIVLSYDNIGSLPKPDPTWVPVAPSPEAGA